MTHVSEGLIPAIPGIGAVELRWSRRKGQIAEISVFELNASSKKQANLW